MTNHDISWFIMTFCHKNQKHHFVANAQLRHFFRENSMTTRSPIAFEDLLASSITPQVMPPCTMGHQQPCHVWSFLAPKGLFWTPLRTWLKDGKGQNCFKPTSYSQSKHIYGCENLAMWLCPQTVVIAQSRLGSFQAKGQHVIELVGFKITVLQWNLFFYLFQEIGLLVSFVMIIFFLHFCPFPSATIRPTFLMN